MEIISIERLKINRIKYFSRKYDESYPKLDIIPVMDSNEITNNLNQIQYFKEKYPIYNKIIKILKNHTDKNGCKVLIINELITYLDDVKHNQILTIRRENYSVIQKKKYSSEFKNIFKDLNMMIYEAILINKINLRLGIPTEKKAHSTVNVSTKPLPKKPGKKLFSENDLIGLKYQIIHRFYVAENPYSLESKFSSIGDFHKKIGYYEKINPGSFKNSYNKIGKEDLNRFCKSKPQMIKQLLKSDAFKNYSLCQEFISQYDIG